MTCKEKVIKVFSISLQLLNLLTGSAKIEKSNKTDLLKNLIVEKNIVLKLLQKSEEGNTRITNRIHETLLDLSFNPEVGEAVTSAFILQRIQAHNRAFEQKKTGAAAEGQIETEAGLGSFKGLLAQLALLYKFVNSFGIASRTRGPLSVRDILKSIMPAIQHPNQDVRNASGKILVDVHKLSGCVNEEELEGLSDKTKNVLLAKLAKVEVEKNLMESEGRAKQNLKRDLDDGDITESAEITTAVKEMASPSKVQSKIETALEKKKIIEEKGVSKDWQVREDALKVMFELFQDDQGVIDDDFIQTCLILLKLSLADNNMTLYLTAVQTASLFFEKALDSETVRGSLQSLLEPIILRTNDTNTRVRKKSVDLIYQIWDHKTKGVSQQFVIPGKESEVATKTESNCTMIANVICDGQLGEKSIIGRLALFIKRASIIEGGKDLAQRPISMMLGKSYEQLVEFGCQWVSHKNTKVRQNALKLIVEICRINCMDPRGLPFKQRIINFIFGLRPNQRGPLVLKINEICLKHIVANTSPGRANDLEPYINADEIELSAATKTRAASMDHMGAKRRLMSASRRQDPSGDQPASSMLPQIGNVNAVRSGVAQPTIVVPHSEPLSEDLKEKHATLIDLFGLQIMTSFFSKSWSARNTAILKV